MESGDHDANYPAGAPTRPVFWDSQYGIGYEGGSSQFHTDTINEHPELRERFGNGDFDIFNPPKGMYMGRKIMFTKPVVNWYGPLPDEDVDSVHKLFGTQPAKDDYEDMDWEDDPDPHTAFRRAAGLGIDDGTPQP